VPEDELGQEIVKLKPHISPNSAYTALKGVQSGYSQPVALALSGRADQVNALSQASYQVFTSLEGLQSI